MTVNEITRNYFQKTASFAKGQTAEDMRAVANELVSAIDGIIGEAVMAQRPGGRIGRGGRVDVGMQEDTADMGRLLSEAYREWQRGK